MVSDSSKNLGRIIKQQRVLSGLTLQKLSEASGVSSSHLGRIERGERFPSAHILRRLAKPLSFDEPELLVLGGYLSRQSSTALDESRTNMQVDPYVAMVLSQEPAEVQRAVMVILSVLKSMAKGLSTGSPGDR